MAYLLIDGTAGNKADTPDAAVLNITGDIDVRLDAALDDWTNGTQTPFAKGNDDQYQFQVIASGALRFYWVDGIHASTVATGFTNGERNQMRVTLDVDNGAGGFELRYFTRSDGIIDSAVGWTPLGATITGGATTSIPTTVRSLTIGSKPNSTEPAAGKYYRAQIYSGIDGTLAFDAHFADPSTWVFS